MPPFPNNVNKKNKIGFLLYVSPRNTIYYNITFFYFYFFLFFLYLTLNLLKLHIHILFNIFMKLFHLITRIIDLIS
jgi:hypothetical protein